MEIQRTRWDVLTGMIFSNVILYFIILATGSTLHPSGQTQIETAAQAAAALEPLAGPAAKWLFAAGIIGVGFLMGDALSHAVVPGVAVAYLAGLPFAVGAFLTGLIAALGMGFVKKKTRLREDAVIGVVFTSFFALGLLMISLYPSTVDLRTILFGNILGIADPDVWQVVIISAVTLAVLGLKWRDLLLHAFDPIQAKAVGLRVNLLHYGLLCLISLTVVGALKAVGVILCIAMLIAPGAIAFLLTRRFGAMLALAVVIALIASFMGVYLSFFLDSAPAPTIVLLLSGGFAIAFLVSRLRAARAERIARPA